MIFQGNKAKSSQNTLYCFGILDEFWNVLEYCRRSVGMLRNVFVFSNDMGFAWKGADDYEMLYVFIKKNHNVMAIMHLHRSVTNNTFVPFLHQKIAISIKRL